MFFVLELFCCSIVFFFFVLFLFFFCFFFQAEDGIRDIGVTGVQTCALPIYVDRLDERSIAKTKGDCADNSFCNMSFSCNPSCRFNCFMTFVSLSVYQ